MYSWFNIKNISVYVTKSCIIKLLKTKYVLPNWVLSTVLNGETEKDPGGNHATWASMFLWLIKQVVTKRCKYRLFIQYGWFQLTHSPRKPPLCHPVLFFYFKQVNDNFKHYRIVGFFFFFNVFILCSWWTFKYFVFNKNVSNDQKTKVLFLEKTVKVFKIWDSTTYWW